MQTQTTKRYHQIHNESNKERQLSSLFNIISSNLLLATEVLSTDYRINAVEELDALSRKARIVAKELVNGATDIKKEVLTEKISQMKHRMLELVINLTEELNSLQPEKDTNSQVLEHVILAKKLLRESQRGLVTIQD